MAKKNPAKTWLGFFASTIAYTNNNYSYSLAGLKRFLRFSQSTLLLDLKPLQYQRGRRYLTS